MEDESLGKSRRLLHLPGVSSVGLSAPALAPVLFHFEITFQVPQGKAQANWEEEDGAKVVRVEVTRVTSLSM
ncbi:hypothetical protein Bca101_075045 [Brassica carinata]